MSMSTTEAPPELVRPAGRVFPVDGQGSASVSGPERAVRNGTLVVVSRAELEGQIQRLHNGALQEIATQRVCLAVWVNASVSGDAGVAREMVPALKDASERLLSELAEIQATLRGWLQTT